MKKYKIPTWMLMALQFLIIVGCSTPQNTPAPQYREEAPLPQTNRGTSPGGEDPSTEPDRVLDTANGESADKPEEKTKSRTDALDCNPGYYCPAGSPPPLGEGLCDAGYYCPKNSTTPTGAGACRRGYFCPQGSTTEQGAGKCEAGYYCPKGSKTATEFPSGEGYYTDSGADSAEPCGKGFYCPLEANRDRIRCENKPDHSTYSSTTAVEEDCPFTCDKGYKLSADQCIEDSEDSNGEDGKPPPRDPFDLSCTVRASALQQGSCSLSCTGNILAYQATPLGNGTQCRLDRDRNGLHTCRAFNSQSVGLGGSPSAICRCDLRCQ